MNRTLLFCGLVANAATCLGAQGALAVCAIDDGGSAIYMNVDEDHAIGTTIGHLAVSGVSFGASRDINLSLIEGRQWVELDETSKALVLVKALDRDTTDDKLRAVVECHSLAASDDGLRVPFNVYITVRDVNDNSPVFSRSRYEVTIDEELPLGTAIMGVGLSTTDADQPGPHSTVVYDIEPADRLRFEHAWIPQLSVAGRIDYEDVKEFDVTITATDGAASSEQSARHRSSVVLHVIVRDVDDLNPIFSHDTYRAILPRDAPIDAPIKVEPSGVVAVDGDTIGSAIALRLLPSPSLDGLLDYADYFALDREGNLRVIGDLDDLAAVNVVMLGVEARQVDRAERASRTSIQLSRDTLPIVVDRPGVLRFDRAIYALAVSEDAGRGVIAELRATVGGAPQSDIAYMLVNSTSSSASFAVNGTTGELSVLGAFDYERETRVALVVNAFYADQRAVASVNVTIVDVNDNAPRFLEHSYRLPVNTSTLQSGDVIGRVTAVDADSSDTLAYSLVDFDVVFAVDARDGSIRFVLAAESHMYSRMFVRLTRQTFPLRVNVRDSATPPHIAMTTVNVVVDGGGRLLAEWRAADLGARMLQTTTLGATVDPDFFTDTVSINDEVILAGWPWIVLLTVLMVGISVVATLVIVWACKTKKPPPPDGRVYLTSRPFSHHSSLAWGMVPPKGRPFVTTPPTTISTTHGSGTHSNVGVLNANRMSASPERSVLGGVGRGLARSYIRPISDREDDQSTNSSPASTRSRSPLPQRRATSQPPASTVDHGYSSQPGLDTVSYNERLRSGTSMMVDRRSEQVAARYHAHRYEAKNASPMYF